MFPADLEGFHAVPLLACRTPADPLHVLRSAHFAHVHLSNHATIHTIIQIIQNISSKDNDTDTGKHTIIQIIQNIYLVLRIHIIHIIHIMISCKSYNNTITGTRIQTLIITQSYKSYIRTTIPHRDMYTDNDNYNDRYR